MKEAVNYKSTSENVSADVTFSYAGAMQSFEERGTIGFGEIEDDERFCGDSKRCFRRGKCMKRASIAFVCMDIEGTL